MHQHGLVVVLKQARVVLKKKTPVWRPKLLQMLGHYCMSRKQNLVIVLSRLESGKFSPDHNFHLLMS